ncbi:sugar transferase, partial [Francisella tularensis subsp. holarctica]|nr:sugar transferase [Francisella tularensis subsp. holarctica]
MNSNLLIILKTIELVISVLLVFLSYSIPLILINYDSSNFCIFDFMATF